jgi:hypothetical protein
MPTAIQLVGKAAVLTSFLPFYVFYIKNHFASPVGTKKKENSIWKCARCSLMRSMSLSIAQKQTQLSSLFLNGFW